ncbi:MAG: acetyl-CoA carboxylase biotin carboxyl carrier protein [Eubacteriales bacterium]|nr:acetyl-CoA carboxylase biotin carboxyl carrier protein [Eubacteriales bacterium]
MNITQLEHLLNLMEQYRLEELEWESDGESIRLKKQAGIERGATSLLETTALNKAAAPIDYGTGGALSATAAQTGAATAPTGQSPTEAVQPTQTEGTADITAEMIGTFYSAPSPEAEPFVSVGDIVEKGAVLCVLEAMKLMNEVEAPYKLKIESIEVKNGSVVEYGQTLFKVREVQ